MVLTLIGMSGTGKSYWSKKLEEKGFVRYCCDDLVEELLGSELKKLGYQGIQDVAKWMGQPYQPRYPQTSKRYLDLEKQVMQNICKTLKDTSKTSNIIIDTTGSVIYTGKEILEALSQLSTIIFLEVPQSIKDTMLKLYLEDPKPVIWGSSFKKKKGETDMQALARCYPLLLSYRTKLYKKYADIVLDYFTLRKQGFTYEDFLKMVQT